LPISAFAVGGTLGLVGYQVDRLINQHNYYGSPASSYNQTSDGKPDLYYCSSNVDTVYVFDAHGKALTDVSLYDQNGEGHAAVAASPSATHASPSSPSTGPESSTKPTN
jgi:hypothetical protein